MNLLIPTALFQSLRTLPTLLLLTTGAHFDQSKHYLSDYGGWGATAQVSRGSTSKVDDLQKRSLRPGD